MVAFYSNTHEQSAIFYLIDIHILYTRRISHLFGWFVAQGLVQRNNMPSLILY